MNRKISNTTLSFFFCCIFLLTGDFLMSQKSFDSLKVKMPRHYLNTVIDLDFYGKPKVYFTDTRPLSNKLKSYGVSQSYLNFYTPLATKNWMSKDSAIRNSHLLLTVNYLKLTPHFEGIPDHELVKFGVGMRYIYNTGKKGVWFGEVSPFVTRDITYPSRPYFRMASTFIYSHNVTAAFNWRLGITKSFLWGNRFYLPFVGLRVGRLDRTHLSIQFPRSISLNFPLGSRIFLSIYTRPQGGMFNFSNADSLYFKNTEATFHFTRYELNTGVRFSVRASRIFSFYIAMGTSTRNNITFYSDKANQNRKGGFYNTYFYSKNLPSTLFLNAGVVLRFGRTRLYSYDKNIYDAIDLNTISNESHNNIPLPSSKKGRTALNLESVQDLIDYDDF